jgi:hypothetical protein
MTDKHGFHLKVNLESNNAIMRLIFQTILTSYLSAPQRGIVPLKIETTCEVFEGNGFGWKNLTDFGQLDEPIDRHIEYPPELSAFLTATRENSGN